jgi:hypothetical protein
MDVLFRVEPDMGGHRDQERVRVRPGDLHADGLPFQVCDAANFVFCE